MGDFMHDVTPKRFAIVLWVFAITLFLYYFSFNAGGALSSASFMAFAAILWGASAAYHVTTKLISCPYNSATKLVWHSMFAPLAKAYLGFAIVAAAIAAAKWIGGDWGYLLAILGTALGMFWSLHYIISLEQPVRKIISLSDVN